MTEKKKEEFELTAKDVELLNTKIGVKNLLADKKVNLEKALKLTRYELKLRELQADLIELQDWVIKKGKKIIILFEGRDAAGKGGAIRRIAAHINPRFAKIIALPRPTQEEKGQWYFQRYVNHFPKKGEIVFFDRSWYNRAVVEPVNGFCTQKEYNIFMNHVNEFEQMIIDSDIYLIKLYFSITKKEQARRFEAIKASSLKRWKLSPVDEKAQELWDEYTKYKEKMLEVTDTENCPWTIIKANRKGPARIKALEVFLDRIPYKKK